ncbi:MAG: TAXI family TRAP transporter solute-binding subunit, partial [bacterium]
GIRKLVSGSPYYVMTVIPGGIYKGVGKDVPTYAVKATFVTGVKQDKQTVYDVVKTVFDNLGKLKASHAAFKYLKPKEMLGGLSAPFHEGALRYYKEKGLK